MAEITHPTLGTITGVAKDGVKQFLGLPYASLSNRFADPKILNDYDSTSGFNATKHGPSAISPPSACDMEFGFIQHRLQHTEFATSETECLNLNVTIPKSNFDKSLPVFVFVHGGGFALGSNAWPQYDLARIVKLSVDLGSPVIGVNINYRLGVFGFLSSADFQNAGFSANRGTQDQRVAFQWIQKHIAGFGGDPTNVTAVGESAGGVSCTLLLGSEEPLFNQVVAMGGNSLLMRPLPPFVAETAFSIVTNALNVDEESSAEEKVQALMESPAETFLTKISPTVPLIPIVDGDIIKSSMTYSDWSETGLAASLPGRAWCKRILVGDCQFDGNILAPMLMPRKGGIATTFRESVTKTFNDRNDSHAAAKSLLEAYSISDNLEDDVALLKILRFATDIGFYASTLTIAAAWPPANAYLYHFNEPNPWDGPYKGEATHILDVAFLFQNFNPFLTDGQVVVAERFAQDFIAFVNGKEPFPAYSAEGKGARVYGPPASGGVSFVKGGKPREYGRRNTVFELGDRVGLDKLSMAWNNFLAGH